MRAGGVLKAHKKTLGSHSQLQIKLGTSRNAGTSVVKATGRDRFLGLLPLMAQCRTALVYSGEGAGHRSVLSTIESLEECLNGVKVSSFFVHQQA